LQTAARGTGVTRSYVETDGGQLALRTAGAGAGRPLVVVPPVPGSGSMLVAEIEAFARDRRVVAIDAPGCGDSDAFDAASAGAMAGAMVQAIDRLGIGEFDVYALNGGCAAAVEIAASLPRAVSNIVLEAPARAHAAIPEYAARYAPPIEPRWDGGHLIALWHSTRNRRLFRPWFDQRLAVRYTGTAAVRLDPESINREVLAGLESWRTYPRAWRAVLEHSTLERARSLGRPVKVAAQASDEFFDPGAERLSEALLPRVGRLRELLDRHA
jgi:pimeloyl-ACP methyl ester carboxylesterase